MLASPPKNGRAARRRAMGNGRGVLARVGAAPERDGAARAANARLRRRLWLFAGAFGPSCMQWYSCYPTQHKEKPRLKVEASSNTFQRGTSVPQSGSGKVKVARFRRSVIRSFGRSTNRLLRLRRG